MTGALFRRARPWLGTLVEIQLDGCAPDRAASVCEKAFAEIAAIHRLMSFHEAGSDLGRLHRAGARTTLRVDRRTRDVLGWALRIAAASDGCFDPTIAAQQVAWGLLPRPAGSASPDPNANWRDIELVGCAGVRLARPLWLDLGGIAKGYAVDRAMDILGDTGASQILINAGGDLRVRGASARVNVRTHAGLESSPRLELANAALATSAPSGNTGHKRESRFSAHVHGRTRRPLALRRSVSVVAERCVVADALTKVVMAASDRVALRVLRQFRAQAGVCRGNGSWTLLGAAA